MNISYRDREGNTLYEDAPGSGFLQFLYGGNPFGKMSLWTLVKRRAFSVRFGKYMDSAASKKRIAPFIEKYKMDMSDYLIPEGGFKHFNDFFYRKIKPEARPISEGLVSPADGRVVVEPQIGLTQKFYIKGEEFNLKSFLKDDSLAKEYAGGSMLVVRLAPVDYHRYHFPADGFAGETVHIKGHYYSVSPLALQRDAKIFWRNQRTRCVLKTEAYGEVIISEIAATLTGSMIDTYEFNTEVKRGQEKGHFAFGGSTVVLLFKKGQVEFSKDLVANSAAGIETYVKMGETVVERISAYPADK